MAVDFQIDEKVIDVFSKYIDKGIEKLGGDVLVIMSIFAIFDMWIALTSAMTSTVEAFKVLTRKILAYGFWFALLKNYSILTNSLYIVFTNIGKAFYSDGTSEATLSVDKLIGEGFSQIGKILKAAISFNLLNSLGWNLFYLAIYVLCFIFLTKSITELVISIIQFRLISGVSLIVLGFVTLEFTKDVGFKAITGLIYAGMKIVVIYSLLTIGFGVIGEFPVPEIKPALNLVHDLASWTVLFVTITYLASESDTIVNLIMNGHAGLNGMGLGTHIASGIQTLATTAAVVVGTVMTVGAGAAAGAAAAGGSAAGGTTAGATGSKISEIFRGTMQGAMDGYKKSKTARDIINNTGHVGSETVSKMTGGKSNTNWRGVNFNFRKKKDDGEEE